MGTTALRVWLGQSEQRNAVPAIVAGRPSGSPWPEARGRTGLFSGFLAAVEALA